MISNQISQNSCDKNHLDKAAPDDNTALENSGLMKISHILQAHSSVKLARGKLFRSILLIALMCKLTLFKYL